MPLPPFMRNLLTRTQPEPKEPDPIPSWTTNREFDIDYAHRTWTGNTLERLLHGHHSTIQVAIESDKETTYRMLDWFELFLDANLEHRFILGLEDPWLINIINGKPVYWKTAAAVVDSRGTSQVVDAGDLHSIETTMRLNTSDGKDLHAVPVFVPGTDHLAGYHLETRRLSGPEQEFFGSFFLVDFEPTSRNLAQWIFQCVQAKMNLTNVRTTGVLFSEAPDLAVEYSEG